VDNFNIKIQEERWYFTSYAPKKNRLGN